MPENKWKRIAEKKKVFRLKFRKIISDALIHITRKKGENNSREIENSAEQCRMKVSQMPGVGAKLGRVRVIDDMEDWGYVDRKSKFVHKLLEKRTLTALPSV